MTKLEELRGVVQARLDKLKRETHDLESRVAACNKAVEVLCDTLDDIDKRIRAEAEGGGQ